MSDCGNCQWFTKWKNDNYGSGLCNLLDRRTNTDCKCDLHQGIKYDRNAERKATKQLIKEQK